MRTDHLPYVDDDPIDFEVEALRDFPTITGRRSLPHPQVRVDYPIGSDLRHAPASALRVRDLTPRPSRAHPIRRIRRARAEHRATKALRSTW